MESISLPTRFVQPDVVTTQFHIRPGDTVADFGAGSGYFLPAVAEATGPEGKVYVCEIQKGLIEKLGEHVRTAGWAHVVPVWGDVEAAEGVAIPPESVDVAMLVNTFFMFEDTQAALATIDRTLRPGGKLCLVDWSESFAGLGPSPEMVVVKQDAIDTLETFGYTLETEFPAGEHHYGLAFRKP